MFPKNINDPFYQQFDDPCRAYSNLPALYDYFLVNPCDKMYECDHINYAAKLASSTKR